MADFYTIHWQSGDRPVAVSTPIVREDDRVLQLAEAVQLPNGSHRRIVFKANLHFVPNTAEAAARLELDALSDRLIEARLRVQEIERRCASLREFLTPALTP